MFEEEEDCQETRRFVQIGVEGANITAWSKLKNRLTSLIIDLLEFNINTKTEGNVKEESQRLAANLLEYANAKLEKPSIENQKLFAEIQGILATQAKTVAEARKINAEADALEIENIGKKLRLAIGLGKALASSSSDPDALIFIKNIEEMAFAFQERKMLE